MGIGIDGCAPWIIRELLKSYDNLRGFRSLSENGLMSTLTSITPPLSGPAWTSIYTGVKPQDHGIFDFVYVTRDYKVRPFGFVNETPFPTVWDFLYKAGLKTIIINPSMVYPSYKVNGVFVSGWPGPRLSVYPKGVESIIRKTQYRMDIDDARATRFL